MRAMRVSNNVNRLREAYEYTMSEWTGHAQTEQHTHTHTPVHACVCVCGDMLNFAARCTSCCCRRCVSLALVAVALAVLKALKLSTIAQR